MIRRIISPMLQHVGFDSPTDLLASTFGIKLKFAGIYLYSGTVAGVILTLEQITESYIYKPALGVLVLFILSVADMVLGISVAVSTKSGIEPRKISRAMGRFIAQCFFTAMAFHMSSVYPLVISSYAVDALLLVFTLTVFVSGFKNARALNLITADQYSVFESLFSLKKIIDKIKNKS